MMREWKNMLEFFSPSSIQPHPRRLSIAFMRQKITHLSRFLVEVDEWRGHQVVCLRECKTKICPGRDKSLKERERENNYAILPYNCVTWTRLFVCLKLDKLFSKLKRSFNSNSLEWMINCNLLHWSDLPGNHCENAGCVLLVACLCTLCISPIHDKTRQSLIRIFCNWAAMWKSQ